MPREIERKFIVATDEWKKHTLVKKIPIDQGYFQRDGQPTVRIRVTNDQAFMTIKGKQKGLTRSEYEYELPYDDGVDLLKMCEKPLVKKVRHVIVDKFNQLWEIDIFKGINKGLVLAEIELDDEKQPVTIPDWLGREVSDDPLYRNTSLAINNVMESKDDSTTLPQKRGRNPR